MPKGRNKKEVNDSYTKWYMREENKKKKSLYDKERMKNPVLIEKKRLNSKELYWVRKMKFFDMYGHECACCGETIKEFLTIEHINGIGFAEKKSRGMNQYMVATREYRPDLYEVLCMNCNHAFGRVGYCPHNPKRRIGEKQDV